MHRTRFNVYKTVQRKVREKVLGEVPPKNNKGRPKTNSECNPAKNCSKLDKKYAQEKFHHHFCQEGHKGIADWEVRLIDSAFCEKSLRKKELFWQFKLNTFHPHGLNEIEANIDIS